MKFYRMCYVILCFAVFLLGGCRDTVHHAGIDKNIPPEKMIDANILQGLTPTTNADVINEGQQHTISQIRIENPEAATDGDHTSGTDDSACTTIIAGKETGGIKNGFDTWKPVYLQYDFKKTRQVKEVRIYRRYSSDPRQTYYYKVAVELSETDDFSQSKVIFQADIYKEEKDTDGITAKPQIITLDESYNARYIRIFQQGHNWNNGSDNGYSNKIRFNEIEVMATVPQSEFGGAHSIDKVPSNEGLYNIAYQKLPYVYGLAPSNLEAISDGKTDETSPYYAVHNSKGEQWLQFEFKYMYKIKNIRFKLADGMYQSVKVSISNRPWSTGKTVFTKEHFMGGSMTDIQFDTLEEGKTVRFTVNKADNEPVSYSEIEIWATESRKNEQIPDYDPASSSSPYNRLVWSDEFNGTEVDEKKWNIINGMANHGAIYTKNAVRIKKDSGSSYLAIRSKNYDTTDNLKKHVYWENYNNQTLGNHVTWESGRIESKNKFSFQFGRVAVRAKVNDSQGIWPAIWMLAQDETGHDEIDILEYLGNQHGNESVWNAWTTNHFGIVDSSTRPKGSDGNPNKNWEAWTQHFHVYEVEWDPEFITWYIDGKKVYTTVKEKGDPVDGMHTRPFFPIIETQVGAGWVGSVDYNKQNTKQDSEYLVDWIRIYQKDNSTVTRFDDLESLEYRNEGYYIGVKEHTDGLQLIKHGTAEYENQHNFFYEGQPRYEANRLAVKEGKSAQSIVYELKNVQDIHLTAYYKTDQSGASIRNDTINFKVESSKDKQSWVSQPARITDCYIETGKHKFVHDRQKYARHIFDVYGLPEGTQFVKIIFPDYDKSPKTDIQLAKVTFQQKNN